MYVDSSRSKRGDKVYVRHLLRTSFREGGKVKHKTIANLSSCSDEEIAAIKLALKHKGDLASLGSLKEIETTLGKSIGGVWVVKAIADRMGISKALGTSKEARLVLLQVIARVIDQGSRLSAVRFATRHAVCEILSINKLDEDDLYENLDWLAHHQGEIEKKLFDLRFSDTTPSLFLYDVTSTYLEGDCNEFADYGYNRDKKKGKKQVVVGLLAGPDGLPVAVRVFKGNTTDSKTVSEQVQILAHSFGVKNITLVGDRGMLRGPQIEALPDDFRYITAITKPQIRKMLNDRVLQMELFTETVCEVEADGVRYILRRNPIRAAQMAESRENKLDSIVEIAEERTEYLAEHPRAHASKALGKVTAKIKKLKTDRWLIATEKDRIITIDKDPEALSEVSLLDGCYVIKSDVPKEDANAQLLHDRYCDLEMVERLFRTAKITHLELRPVFVRKRSRTQGHTSVIMLALLIQRELERCWSDLDITVVEGIGELSSIHMQQVKLGDSTVQGIPKPTGLGKQLLATAGVMLPTVLPAATANVYTKTKLQTERK